MLDANVTRLLDSLSPDALVLDVGGWACPFNRAQWILDAEPFETRGYYRTFGGAAFQGGEREWFSKETWVQRDFCAREPWPFADKQFDFVVCSHTLEDIRDPLWVCSELMRVAKAGYIEVPSRIFESTLGVERPNIAGLSHHRWLIDIAGDEIRFLQKYHLIHSHWRYNLPNAYLRSRPSEASVQWLWWNGEFRFSEVTIHGLANQERELERFAEATDPRSPWRLRASDAWRSALSLPLRGLKRVLRGDG
ncbi:MAG TPA: methyltransferase domain-containing protein [Vicinamibacterales bacterium]